MTTEPKTPQLFDLSEAVQGMNRREAMRTVVGPYVTQLLRPAFEPEFTSEEAKTIPPIYSLQSLLDVSSQLREIAMQRKKDTIDTFEAHKISALSTARPDLLYYELGSEVLVEGVSAGVMGPSRIAAQIYIAERIGITTTHDAHRVPEPFADHKVKGTDVLEILQRPIISNILMSLCKGPNGFLGTRSLHVNANSLGGFFDFRKLGEPEEIGGAKLSIYDAFEMKGGRVIGLSDEFFISANNKRKAIKAKYQNKVEEVKAQGNDAEILHAVTDSAGCPVRHGFEDEDGNPQEPLIIVAKNFVTEGIRVATDKAI